ncbi:hypothetical protein YC2023_057637 [Brassica napus]
MKLSPVLYWFFDSFSLRLASGKPLLFKQASPTLLLGENDSSKGEEVVSLGKRLLPARSGEPPFSSRRGPVNRRSVPGEVR